MQNLHLKYLVICLALTYKASGRSVKKNTKEKHDESVARSEMAVAEWPASTHNRFSLDTLQQSLGRSTSSILNSANCGVPRVASSSSFTPRIVNGTEAERGEWPWQAMILQYDSPGSWYVQVCGGTLLGKQWVLTAAHCFDGQPAAYTHVVLGANLREFSGPQVKRVAVSSIHCHEGYNTATFKDDICLLKLAGEVQYTDYIIPACLPADSTGVIIGETCTVTGWGDTKGTGTRDVLREASVMVIDHNICESWYAEENQGVPTNHICAGYPEGLVDTCQGDSGGPMVCQSSSSASTDSSYVLQGVTSFGIGCARKERPGLYTGVAKYLDWIDTTIARNAGPEECFTATTFASRSIITANGTILRSPVNDTETWLYPSNVDAYWDIEAPLGQNIRLEFICHYLLEMESIFSCYDYIVISASDIGYRRTHCGTELPRPVLIASNKARITFHSDSSRESLGFVTRVSFVKATGSPSTVAPETTITSAPPDVVIPTTPATTTTTADAVTTQRTTTNSALSPGNTHALVIFLIAYFILVRNALLGRE